MIRTPARFTIRALLAALFFTGVIAAVGVVVPAGAGAFASIEGPPVFSSAPGLPDGRVYEQVSPANKHGNEAGAGTDPFFTGARNHYGYASQNGEAVLFEGTGPMGESPWGDSVYFVASKNANGSGWSTRALQPRGIKAEPLLYSKNDYYLDPSLDLSHAMVEPAGSDPLAVESECAGGISTGVYLLGSDPFIPGTWLERPSPELSDPIEVCADGAQGGAPVGGSPDFSTVYFAHAGTLLPEDAPRAPHAGAEAWGLYEYKEGALAEAGVLPDGSISAFGAIAAASGHGHNRIGDQVSQDGKTLFFVSPDPASCEPNGHNDCSTDPPELYARVNGSSTLLASMDALPPNGGGTPAAGPNAILRMPNPTSQTGTTNLDGSYVFASPDGSQAFFQSEDALTEAAEQAAPGPEAKTYDFDVDTDTVTYLPGVSGEILATDETGSRMVFLRPAEGGKPPELDLWTAGNESGGTVTPIVRLSRAGSIPETRISNDGSGVVFQTEQNLSGTFNSGGFEEIYRYSVPTNTLGCISCAPAGVTPRRSASMSTLYANENDLGGEVYEKAPDFIDERAISANGQRIFFESPDPLVPQDVNTNSPSVPVNETEYKPQGEDVYEWENGVVYLISTGTSTRDSYLLDSSESGDDVFFATAQSLVPGDTDGGYDVYDARVPRPGEGVRAVGMPCEGSVCQGPPDVPSPLAAPASATFSGLGNPPPEVAPPASGQATSKVRRCAKGKKLTRDKCVSVKRKKRARKASVDRSVKS